MPDWWLDAANDRKAAENLLNRHLSDMVARALGQSSVDESRISRCLSGERAPMDLVEALSQVLTIPSPVYIAKTVAEAREMAAVQAAHRRSRELASVDKRIESMEIDAKQIADTRTAALQSRHAPKSRRGRAVDSDG